MHPLSIPSRYQSVLILEAWHIKSREDGLTGETLAVPTQCTPLIQIAKTGWCKQLDKVSKKQRPVPSTTPALSQHPTETPPITQPTRHHVQPRNEPIHVRAPGTQKQE